MQTQSRWINAITYKKLVWHHGVGACDVLVLVLGIISIDISISIISISISISYYL